MHPNTPIRRTHSPEFKAVVLAAKRLGLQAKLTRSAHEQLIDAISAEQSSATVLQLLRQRGNQAVIPLGLDINTRVQLLAEWRDISAKPSSL